MIKAIIFDCFGVLYPDTYWAMASEYLGKNIESNRQELSYLVKKVDLGLSTRNELWAKFAVVVGSDKESVRRRLQEFGGLDKRLLSFIENKKSKYKIGMISNVGQGFIERMFTGKPAHEYFDSIILSSDVGFVKPDKRIYELSARQLNCQTNECVFIDDLEKNVKGAISAGMESIQYRDYNYFIQKIEKII